MATNNKQNLGKPYPAPTKAQVALALRPIPRGVIMDGVAAMEEIQADYEKTKVAALEAKSLRKDKWSPEFLEVLRKGNL